MKYKINKAMNERMDKIQEMILKHLPTDYMPSTDIVTKIHKEENCIEKGISKDHITIVMGIMYALEDPNIDIELITTLNKDVYYIIRRKKQDETPKPTDLNN